MKTYTITAAQLTELIEVLAYGEAILSDIGTRGAYLSSYDLVIKKFQNVQKELAWIEFEG